MENNNKTRISVKGRLSYTHLFKPHAAIAGQEEKYSTTILIPKSETAMKQKIDNAVEEATKLGVSEKWNGVKPPVIPNPIHDGDGVKADGTPYGPECKGHWVFTASAKKDYPPQVVD
ncbi:MAG: DUF2815 family protein, partial [Pseudoleptotrichia goodfellowii]|nr:DUF2815 family protein [Pseudoleptotrichia goodfellowii]